MKLSLISLLLVLLTGCCPKILPVSETTSIDTTYTVRDSIVHLPADTAQLYLRWDEICNDRLLEILNQPRDKDTVIRYLKANRTSGTITAGKKGITFTCLADSLLLELELRDRTIQQMREVRQTAFICDSKWHGFLNYLFWIVALVLIVRQLLKIPRPF